MKPNTAKALAFMAGGHLVYASSVNMPPRPYLGLSADDEQEITHITELFFSELLDQ